ncbi:hypothetical protein EDC94DRAFT_581402 [Helicostylum pulchrum]|nr:hypothetical protein EDC94DRAFT_581402 [Helicostylum pulchrum]
MSTVVEILARKKEKKRLTSLYTKNVVKMVLELPFTKMFGDAKLTPDIKYHAVNGQHAWFTTLLTMFGVAEPVAFGIKIAGKCFKCTMHKMCLPAPSIYFAVELSTFYLLMSVPLVSPKKA